MSQNQKKSGKKKEHKLKLLGPDLFQWEGVFHVNGAGVKKFGLSFEAHGEHTYFFFREKLKGNN